MYMLQVNKQFKATRITINTIHHDITMYTKTATTETILSTTY